jgi:hypothetical protein
LIREVLGQRRLADTVWSDEDDVCGFFKEVDRAERFAGATIATLWPLPIEFGERFETPELRPLPRYPRSRTIA